MRRPRRATLVASIVAVAIPVILPASAGAGPVEDQRREVERIVDELERLEERSDILTEVYAVAVDDKRRLDDEVVAAEARVAAKEAEVDQLRGELSTVAVRAFT